MSTLLMPGRSDPERDAVAQAWVARGGDVRFIDRFWEPPFDLRDDLRLYGDMIFCLALADRLNLGLVSPPDDLLLNLDFRWLGRDVAGTTLDSVLVSTLPAFVKPLRPKTFRSRVYADAEALAEETNGLEAVTPVLVSPPVTFAAEARCLLLDKEVVSASVYEGQADSVEAARFAATFEAMHLVAPTYILDVGIVEGNGWVVVEANATWGGGLNGCDPDAMARCLEHASGPRR